MKYFKKHPAYVATVHLLGGIGVGAILTYPVFSPHQVRWGAAFIGLAILGHLYAWMAK